MSDDPAFPITVPKALYDAVVEACDRPFADSYLWNARVTAGRMTPHTQTAFLVLKRSFAVSRVLREQNTILVEPSAWPGKPERPGARELLPDLFANRTPPRKGRHRPDWDAY